MPEHKHTPLTDDELSNAEIFGLITPGIQHSSHAKHDDVRRLAREVLETRRLLRARDHKAALWAEFAAAALTAEVVNFGRHRARDDDDVAAHIAAQLADAMFSEYEKRFGGVEEAPN